MTIVCVRCETVVSRYAPVQEREAILCSGCTTQLLRGNSVAGQTLHCGREDCLFEVVPYGCLMAEARDVPIEACPAVA